MEEQDIINYVLAAGQFMVVSRSVPTWHKFFMCKPVAAMGQGRLEGTLNLCPKNLGAQERWWLIWFNDWSSVSESLGGITQWQSWGREPELQHLQSIRQLFPGPLQFDLMDGSGHLGWNPTVWKGFPDKTWCILCPILKVGSLGYESKNQYPRSSI